ncbi:hypothetical protein NDU88_005255 [Pleurodeles waltl]|uniref:Uncharacterized protein n=1 Tax=Pleurodeles waltl TaxID=8319 RepID=A0AAV7UHK7_PLEWA|nr:hypothetical protein NDU88_005255 [Pleurodeles waltl]
MQHRVRDIPHVESPIRLQDQVATRLNQRYILNNRMSEKSVPTSESFRGVTWCGSDSAMDATSKSTADEAEFVKVPPVDVKGSHENELSQNDLHLYSGTPSAPRNKEGGCSPDALSPPGTESADHSRKGLDRYDVRPHPTAAVRLRDFVLN